MNLNKIKTYLGFAKKKGKLSYGQTVLKEIGINRNRLVLIDGAASDNTKDRFSSACAAANVKWFLLPAGEIAGAIGKPNVRVICIKDANLIRVILENLD